MTDIWDASDKRLYEACLTTITRFVREHSDAEVCSFFFDCDDPCYGHMSISLDTLENNIRTTIELERFAIENRQKNLSGEIAWQSAQYQLGTPTLSPFNTNSGDFEFQGYAEVEFPAWIELAEKGSYPRSEEHEDDYLESNARLVMWRVAEQLVADAVFADLKLASPFMVGYSLHDQEEVLLRLLNWPKTA